MAAAGVVEYQPAGATYALPEEHAAFLTRDAPPDNVASFLQWVALMGSVEDRIIDCFKNGGGVPYSEFPRFQEIMLEDSGQTVVPVLLDHILPLVTGLQDALREGVDVLGIGCGSGRALNIMAAEYPNTRTAVSLGLTCPTRRHRSVCVRPKRTVSQTSCLRPVT